MSGKSNRYVNHCRHLVVEFALVALLAAMTALTGCAKNSQPNAEAPKAAGDSTTAPTVVVNSNYFEEGWKVKMQGADDKARLGMQLFFDTKLSSPAGQACASCHSPIAAFTDPDRNFATSKGVITGRFGGRNSPSAMYAAFSPPFGRQQDDEGEWHYVGGQFWDGRAATLEEQAKGPFLNALEMNNPDKKSVVEKVRAAYAAEFEAVFKTDVFKNVDEAYDKIAETIAAFERTPVFAPFSSKYDAFLAGKVDLSAAELRGLKLFNDPKKGNCAACHPSDVGPNGEAPLFTDFTYDNLGLPHNPKLPLVEKVTDYGLAATTGVRKDKGKFKVPTLRNIALSAPYGHNGYFQTLKGIVAFYNTRDARPACKNLSVTEEQALKKGCWPAAEVIENVNNDELGRLGLTGEEEDDIVAFLGTLTDGYSVR